MRLGIQSRKDRAIVLRTDQSVDAPQHHTSPLEDGNQELERGKMLNKNTVTGTIDCTVWHGICHEVLGHRFGA